jgi:hypothetical protein
LAPNDPAIADPVIQELCGEAVNLCCYLHVNASSIISIDDKIDLAARMNYESFSRSYPPESPSSPLFEAEPVVKLEATEPEASSNFTPLSIHF